jgi:periplasmic divalent cation tolerance protein
MEITPGAQTGTAPEGVEVRIVLVTVPDMETGQAVARSVVEARLAACGNVVPGVVSIYRWEGGVHEDPEYLLIFKTVAEKVAALEATVVRQHPYEVPEFLVLPVMGGYQPYLNWVAEETA